jgi:hypothetical protein
VREVGDALNSHRLAHAHRCGVRGFDQRFTKRDASVVLVVVIGGRPDLSTLNDIDGIVIDL